MQARQAGDNDVIAATGGAPPAGEVQTAGTRSGAGCRPASRGLTLELVTQIGRYDAGPTVSVAP
jgi:hypothetical protein